MTEALFDLPGVPALPEPVMRTPRPPRLGELPPLPTPRLPLACRWCSRPLADWCAASDALPEGRDAWSRIAALVHEERDLARTR